MRALYRLGVILSINSVHKGKKGEVEFCKWLDKNLGIKTERNYNQSKGGSDIIIDDFIFEIKRCEVLKLEDWWYQVAISKQKHENQDLIPIVCFRQNRKPWEFLLPAYLICGLDKGFLRASESIFLQFARSLIKTNEC